MSKVCKIEITNPEKLVFKKEKISKIEIVKYYEKVGTRMLKYINEFPLSVIRCHDGVNKDCFFKKHPTTENEHISIFKLKGENYFYIKDKAEIIYQAQMGTVEFHSWGSKFNNINKPCVMVFDLDPDKKLTIEKLRQGVKDLKNILDGLNLTAFLKTSGGKGYHIVLPFDCSCGWTKFSVFAKQIARLMEEKWPEKYTTNVRKIERKGKIFVDYMRNKKGATCVAPYSLRAREGAVVSMPILWSELDKILPNEITIQNALERLKKKDPWQDFFKIKQKII